jgi:uncharacterized protein (TIGR03435 family)
MTMIRPLLLLLAAAAFAQTPAAPPFETASIKPTPKDFRGPGMFQYLPGGRFHTTDVWLKYLIQRAYNLEDYQIVGGPSWLNADTRYDIEAKAADGSATKDQLRLMLQTLLAERCQLKTHQESREFSVYNLIVAKGGPKFIALKEGELGKPCSRENDEMPCGMHTMAQIADWLKSNVLHPVLDKTGLSGTYDLHMMFDPFEAQGRPTPPEYAGRPTLTTALNEQLGLKMEPAKAQIPVLVIDSIQKPSEN